MSTTRMRSTTVHTCGIYSTNVHARRPRSRELDSQIDSQPRIQSPAVAEPRVPTSTPATLVANGQSVIIVALYPSERLTYARGGWSYVAKDSDLIEIAELDELGRPTNRPARTVRMDEVRDLH